jgi:hypothetical protein
MLLLQWNILEQKTKTAFTAATEMIDPEPRTPLHNATLQNICTNKKCLKDVFWKWPSSGPGLDKLSEGAYLNCLKISKKSYRMPVRILKSKIRSFRILNKSLLITLSLIISII